MPIHSSLESLPIVDHSTQAKTPNSKPSSNQQRGVFLTSYQKAVTCLRQPRTWFFLAGAAITAGLTFRFFASSNALASTNAEKMAVKGRNFFTPFENKMDFGIVDPEAKLQQRVSEHDDHMRSKLTTIQEMDEIFNSIRSISDSPADITESKLKALKLYLKIKNIEFSTKFSFFIKDIYSEKQFLNKFSGKIGHQFSDEEKLRIHGELDSHYESEKIDDVMKKMSRARTDWDISKKDYEIALAIAIV